MLALLADDVRALGPQDTQEGWVVDQVFGSAAVQVAEPDAGPE